MKIYRHLSSQINNLVKPGQVLIIYGPRQVGKTTLLNQYLNSSPKSTKIYQGSGENSQLQRVLESHDFSKILPFFRSYDLVAIDEAQQINQVGVGLKILVDQLPQLQIIATGSSSFALSNQVGEPLVGRHRSVVLYPLASSELEKGFGSAYPQENLENSLIFGGYPKVLTTASFAEKSQYLTRLKDAYLYKDILELEQIRHPKKIEQLLRLLAYQIGQQVSIQELATQVGLNHNTVSRYLDLLEKSFVIINIGGYAKNLRKEITKTSRYYFFDNGVRNALISNFNSLEIRNDVGQLWENYLVMERIKANTYQNKLVNYYFWRTWDQQEIDLVEEREGKLFGFEFKWKAGKKITPPKSWRESYPQADFSVIDRDNYLQFIK